MFRYVLPALIAISCVHEIDAPPALDLEAAHSAQGKSPHHPDVTECPPCPCEDTGWFFTGYGDGDQDDEARGPTSTGAP